MLYTTSNVIREALIKLRKTGVWDLSALQSFDQSAFQSYGFFSA